jgi:hypothetical protein
MIIKRERIKYCPIPCAFYQDDMDFALKLIFESKYFLFSRRNLNQINPKKMAQKTTTTSKSTAAKKTKNITKATTAGKKSTPKRTTTKKQEFIDEEIAMKAYDIYKARIARGEQGHSDDDWHKAVKELRKEKK